MNSNKTLVSAYVKVSLVCNTYFSFYYLNIGVFGFIFERLCCIDD